MIKDVCYGRVSIELQDEARQQYLWDKAMAGKKYIKFFDKGVSGETDPMTRPQLCKAVKYCIENNCRLVVTDIDRLCRKAWKTERWIEEVIEPNKIELVVINDPEAISHPDIRLIKSTLSQVEKRLIRARTKAKMEQIKNEIDNNGFYVTKAGRKISKLGVHKNMSYAHKRAGEAAAANAMNHYESIMIFIEDATKNCSSLSQIASYLNTRKVSTPRGGKWYPSSVKNILARKNSNAIMKGEKYAH